MDKRILANLAISQIHHNVLPPKFCIIWYTCHVIFKGSFILKLLPVQYPLHAVYLVIPVSHISAFKIEKVTFYRILLGILKNQVCNTG